MSDLNPKEKVTHRKHKTSSRSASLPSSGAVGSPEAQRTLQVTDNAGRERTFPGEPQWQEECGGRLEIPSSDLGAGGAVQSPGTSGAERPSETIYSSHLTCYRWGN